MYLPLADYDYVQKMILSERTFFELPELLACRSQLKLAGAAMLDIGANIGNHAIFFSAICGVQRCVAFEPNPYTASILARNIALNDLRNVEIREAALSDSDAALAIESQPDDNLGGTTFKVLEGGRVRGQRLDDTDIGPIDFIKLDVEGMALNVLRGAKVFIAEQKPAILIELWKSEYDNCDSLLRSLGYNQTLRLERSNFLYERRRVL